MFVVRVRALGSRQNQNCALFQTVLLCGGMHFEAPLPKREDGVDMVRYRTFRTITIVLAFFVVISAFFLLDLVHAIGESPYFAFALAGSFVIYMASRPTRIQIAVTIFVGILLRFIYEAVIGVKDYWGSELICTVGFIGTTSLIMLARKAIQNKQLSEFVIAAFLPLMAIIVALILPITSSLSPMTFDAHLLAVDETLGFQPSFLLGRLFSEYPHWPLWELTSTVYYASPFAIALLCAAHVTENFSEVRRLFTLFAAVNLVGFCIYVVCPATGPIYAFSKWFPLMSPHLSDIQLSPLAVPSSPRNAIPSLHLSWALLIFWNTAGMRKTIRIAAGLFLGGTVFATLSLGEHYLIDLIVAVPFSLIFQAAFTNFGHENIKWRNYAVLGGAGIVAGWIIMIRFCILSLVTWPAATRFFLIFTLGASVLARYKLALCDLKLSRGSELWVKRRGATIS